MTRTPLSVRGDLKPGGRLVVEYGDESNELRARSIMMGRARAAGLKLHTQKLAPGVVVGHTITRLPGDGTYSVVSDNGVDSVRVAYTPGDQRAAQRARGRWRYRLEQRLAPGAYVLSREVRPGLLELNGYNVPA